MVVLIMDRLHFFTTLLVIFVTHWVVLQGQPDIITPADYFIRAAKIENILKYMNLSADPCDDFYKFACGNWGILNPATKENKQTSVFLMGQNLFNNQIAAVLANNDADDAKIMEKPKNFYRSCMNVSRVKSDYRDKLIEIVREFGGMPLLEGDRWRAEDFDWLQTIALIAYKYDRTILLGFSTKTDSTDKNKKISVLRHFDFPLKSVAMYLNGTNKVYRDEYEEKVASDLRDFLNVEPNSAKQVAMDIMELTILLAQGADKNTTPEGEQYDVTTLISLQEKYSGRLDVKMLAKLFPGSIQFKVIEVTPSYQENLINLMKQHDKRKIANFIFYYLMKPFMVFAREPTTSRQDHCSMQTRLVFYDLIENTMYHQLNVTQAETAVRNIFADLKSVFQSALISSRYSWMRNTTRSYAVEKLRRMTIQIESHSHINFIHKYGNLDIGPHDYIANLKAVYAHKGRESRANINAAAQEYPTPNFRLGPAFYHKENSVHIPVITLLPHLFWSASYPNAVNFAQLGFFVAHEIVHAFDDVGRQHDKHGNVDKWWDRSSQRAFFNRTQCFANQYKKYTYGGNALPERKVQMENIADNGGIRLAYEVYMTWYTSPWHPRINVDWETLAPLPFSSQQLFFLSCAQQWCHNTHPYYKNMLTSIDTHTPANLRIIGAFSNMEEFAGVFQCPSGSGMNPLHKCRIY